MDKKKPNPADLKSKYALGGTSTTGTCMSSSSVSYHYFLGAQFHRPYRKDSFIFFL